MKTFALIFCVAFFAIACQDGNDVMEKATDRSLAGTWLYTEYGYSPGAGYITENVPVNPPQTLTFRENLTLTTNIDGLTKFHFYRIFEDSIQQTPIVAFYREDPGNGPHDISKLEHSYSIVATENTLKLYYRWCIEGCHIGFGRLSGEETE